MITMILLTVVFLAVVVPQALSARAERNREFLASIQLHSPSVPDEPQPQPTRRPRSAAARRRTIFTLLLVSMAVTAVPAVVTPSKATLVTQLAVDDCFLAYVGLLVRRRDALIPVAASAPAPAPADDLIFTPVAAQPVLRIG